MEVNNRFDLLASLSVDNEPEEPASTNDTSSEPSQIINDKQQARSLWEIPDYVEKPIPCTPVVTTKAEKTPRVRKIKTSTSMKTTKPSVDIPKCEEQEEEVQTVEIQDQPATYSYYPPQPYKFKQTPANHQNQTMTKFHRNMNVLPKHTSSRGNSKASTHQI